MFDDQTLLILSGSVDVMIHNLSSNSAWRTRSRVLGLPQPSLNASISASRSCAWQQKIFFPTFDCYVPYTGTDNGGWTRGRRQVLCSDLRTTFDTLPNRSMTQQQHMCQHFVVHNNRSC